MAHTMFRRPTATIVLLIVGVLVSVPPSTAQVSFSGEVAPQVTLNVRDSDDYAAPLNPAPDNPLGIDDVSFRNRLDLKLSDAGQRGAMDLWLRLGQYPIAEMLVGAASTTGALAGLTGDTLDDLAAGVADLAWQAPPYLHTVDVMRASVAWMPDPTARIVVGRQSFLTGYGYGWNPVDLANPPKDPTDPTAAVKGVDAAVVELAPALWLTTELYVLLPSPGEAVPYDELRAGTEVTIIVPSVEVKLAGLYGGAESDDNAFDRYPHAGAAAAYVDVAGVGVYGEGVVRSRSRRNLPDAAGGRTSLRTGPVFSGLAGAEYYFASGVSMAAEYFHNGEGFDDGERRDYAAALNVQRAAGAIGGEYYALFTPAYFSRHYALLNIMLPWYDREAEFNVNIVYSPDAQALLLTPSAAFNLTYAGTMRAEVWYGGVVSLDDDAWNEATLSPINHSVWFTLRYYF